MARWRYRRSSHVARRLTLEAEQQKYSEIAALMSVTVGLSQFRNAMQSFHTAWNHSENQNQTGLGGKADIQRERHCDRLMLRRTAGRAIQLHTSQQWCCAPAPSPVGVKGGLERRSANSWSASVTDRLVSHSDMPTRSARDRPSSRIAAKRRSEPNPGRILDLTPRSPPICARRPRPSPHSHCSLRAQRPLGSASGT